MKQIRGITQQKLIQVLIPVDDKCCGGGPLTEVITEDSDSVSFSGSGTQDDPLTAFSSGGSISTQDSATITFSGDGSSGNPLTAEVAGGGSAPSLNSVVNTGGNNTFNATITQQGTISYRVWEGNISFFQDTAGSVFSGSISGATAAGTLSIQGGSGGIILTPMVTMQGTGSVLNLTATVGSVINTTYNLGATTYGRIGVTGNNVEVTALNSNGNVNITPGTSGSVVFPLTGLAAGANTPITASMTILQALANLQAQIDAL